jgi:fluoroquinolone resistance protein
MKLEANEIENQTISDLELESGDLAGKQIYGCTFKRAKLIESKWEGARLESCAFEDCDLSRMRLRNLRLVDVAFRRTRLMGSDWTEVSPNPSVTFEECDLRYATFVKVSLRKAIFKGCKIVEANFVRCDLIEADFSGSDLTGTNFEECELGKADLSAARGAFVDPSRNRVKDARISRESAAALASFFGMRVED